MFPPWSLAHFPALALPVNTCSAACSRQETHLNPAQNFINSHSEQRARWSCKFVQFLWAYLKPPMQTYYEMRTCLGQYGSVSWLFALVKFSCWTLIWVVGSSWITFLSPLDHVAFAFLLSHAHHDPNFVKPCRRTLKFNGLFLRSHDCRRKFRSETSDNMDSWKAEVRRARRDKTRRKKMQMREKIGKSRFTMFQWFVAPEGRKVGSLKRRVRSQLARWDMKKCTPLWREAHFQVKMDKTLEKRTTFGSWDVEKVRAVVARSTFWSQNVQNTPLLEVAMSKKCTPLWREAHFEVKMYKAHHGRTTFGSSDVEKVHAVVARSTFPSQKC